MSKEIKISSIGGEENLLSTIIVPESEHQARIQRIPPEKRKEYNRRLVYWKKEVDRILDSDHHFPNTIYFDKDLLELPSELHSEPRLPGFIFDGLYHELVRYPIPIPLQSIEDQIKQKGTVTWEGQEWNPESLLEMFLNKWNVEQKNLINAQCQFAQANITPFNPRRGTLFNKPGRKYDDEFQIAANCPNVLLYNRGLSYKKYKFKHLRKKGLIVFDMEEINSIDRHPLLFCPKNNYMFLLYDIPRKKFRFAENEMEITMLRDIRENLRFGMDSLSDHTGTHFPFKNSDILIGLGESFVSKPLPEREVRKTLCNRNSNLYKMLDGIISNDEPYKVDLVFEIAEILKMDGRYVCPSRESHINGGGSYHLDGHPSVPKINSAALELWFGPVKPFKPFTPNKVIIDKKGDAICSKIPPS